MVSKDLPRNPRIYKKLWLIPIFIVAANAMQFEKKNFNKPIDYVREKKAINSVSKDP